MRRSPIARGLLWMVLGLALSCTSYGPAHAMQEHRFYVANSTLEVLYLDIDANGDGALNQAYVSPGSTLVRKVSFKLLRIRQEGGTEYFEVRHGGAVCDSFTLRAVPNRALAIGVMGSMTQAFSSVPRASVEYDLAALEHVAALQRGYGKPGIVIKPSGFPPGC